MPRTSAMIGYFALSASSSGRRVASMRAASASRSRDSICSNTAIAAAHDDRVAAEGAAEPARLGGVHDLGAAGDRGEREAAGDALGAQHEVGNEAEVLAREVRAGAGHAATGSRRR